MTLGPLLLTPEEAADALRIGRTRLYGLLASGELPSVKLGGSRRISVTALERYVEGLAGVAVPPEGTAAPGGVIRGRHAGRVREAPSAAADPTPSEAATALPLWTSSGGDPT